MVSAHGIALLLSVLVGLLLGWLAWALLRVRRMGDSNTLQVRDEVLLTLLGLAAFSLGSFVTFILLLGL